MATFLGIAFPFQAGAQEFPASATDADLIRQSIIQIIMTQKGERLMRPDFGSNVMRYIFENNTPTLAMQLKTEVYSAITKFEPRAIIQSVDVEQEDSAVTITITFIVLATNQQDTVTLELPKP